MEHSTKQVIIREDPSARQAHINPKEKNNPNKKIREKNRSVASGLSVIDFEHLWSSRSDEHVNSAWYCLEYSTKQIKHQ